MLNKYRVCPMCGCNSSCVAGLCGDSCGDEVVVNFVCTYCGCAFEDRIPPAKEAKQEKEEPTMQVSYNGFTGELYKLERRSRFSEESFYDLEIFDIEKKCNMQFFGIKLEDRKFMGGAVAFGG